MAGAGTNITLAGNTFVKLSDILEQLSGTLSPSQIDDLLYSIISKRKKEVSPGDLITADLMNQVLRDLAVLEAKVAGLSAAQPDLGTGVKITEPTASTIVRVGGPLVIRGRNLLADSSVFIENQPIAEVIGSADATKLTIRQLRSLDLPRGIRDSGVRLQLLVINDAGSDSTEFTLKPGVMTKPIGKIVITPSGGPQAGTKFTKGGSYPFEFKVSADVKPAENYDVSASIGNAAWTATPELSELPIPVAADSRTPAVKSIAVTVKIADDAQSGDSGALTVTLSSKLDSSFSFTSEPAVPIAVNATAAEVPKLGLTLTDETNEAAGIRTNRDGTKTAIIGEADGSGGKGGITILVTRTDNKPFEPGDYKIDLALLKKFVGDDSTPKWSAAVPGVRADGKVKLQGAAITIPVDITAKAGAKNATMILDVVKADDATIAGHAEIKVERAQ